MNYNNLPLTTKNIKSISNNVRVFQLKKKNNRMDFPNISYS